MKISQVKEILNSIFEEDDSLKYALATNLAKYGRPQSKKSDKPSKLTKGLEKKREKHVKDLKKSMKEASQEAYMELQNIMDQLYDLSDQAKSILRSEYPEAFRRLDAYGALDFGTSTNQYDTTFEKALDNLEGRDDLDENLKEKIDLVHVYDKDGKMFGTGERVSTSGDKTLVRFDGSTEKEYPTSQVKTVKEQDMGSPFPGEKPNKGYTVAREIIAMLREKVYPKLNDSELEEFGTTMHDHFMDYMKESISEDKADATRWFSNLKYFYQKAFGELKGEDRETYKQLAKDFFSKLEIDDKVRSVGLSEGISELEKIADSFSSKFSDLRFRVNSMADRIDVYGSQQALMDFGSELSGKKIGEYEVFWTQDDDRGEIVRIVRSDKIMRENYKVAGRTVKLNKGKKPDGTDWTVTFPNGKTTSLADVLALIEPKPGLNEKAKKADRCLRIARRKIPQSSAYRSGLIVKCRKGMIWKKEK